MKTALGQKYKVQDLVDEVFYLASKDEQAIGHIDSSGEGRPHSLYFAQIGDYVKVPKGFGPEYHERAWLEQEIFETVRSQSYTNLAQRKACIYIYADKNDSDNLLRKDPSLHQYEVKLVSGMVSFHDQMWFDIAHQLPKSSPGKYTQQFPINCAHSYWKGDLSKKQVIEGLVDGEVEFVKKLN